MGSTRPSRSHRVPRKPLSASSERNARPQPNITGNLPPETLIGERGRVTGETIAKLAIGALALNDVNENYSIGPGGSIEVRLDDASVAMLADPAGHVARRSQEV